MLWTDLPEAERVRLIARERAQRAETKRLGLPVEPVSVEALWLLQAGRCGCEARCAPLNPLAVHGDPDHIVIGHVNGRKFNGGHLIRFVFLQLAACNGRDAARENTERASRRRAEAVRGLKPAHPSVEAVEAGCAAPSPKRRGFQKRTGPSALSSKSDQYKRAKAMKEKR